MSWDSWICSWTEHCNYVMISNHVTYHPHSSEHCSCLCNSVLTLHNALDYSLHWFLVAINFNFFCPAEIKSDYTNHYISVGQGAVIRTITMEAENPTPATQAESLPLVMVHGFGAGLLQFYKNLDHLHGNQRLMAFDLPGFGRSSRIRFPKDAEGAEDRFVELIEEWREGMGVSAGSVCTVQ